MCITIREVKPTKKKTAEAVLSVAADGDAIRRRVARRFSARIPSMKPIPEGSRGSSLSMLKVRGRGPPAITKRIVVRVTVRPLRCRALRRLDLLPNTAERCRKVRKEQPRPRTAIATWGFQAYLWAPASRTDPSVWTDRASAPFANLDHRAPCLIRFHQVTRAHLRRATARNPSDLMYIPRSKKYGR